MSAVAAIMMPAARAAGLCALGSHARQPQPHARRHQPAHVHAGRGRPRHRLLAAHRQVRDLLCLALTCRRFGIKCIVSAAGGGGAAAAAGQPLSLSIVEEAARRYRLYRCSEQEQGWVPTYGVGLGLMHEVEVLRLPLAFGRAHANITLFENGAVATRTTIGGMGGSSYHSAASSIVMRSGRHFAQFTVQRGTDMAFGVLLASCDVEETSDALDDFNGVHYWTMCGGRFTGGYNWQGMQAAMAPGDRIGLLLDLDQGSMSVWKNGDVWG